MPTNYWLKFGNTPLGYNGSGVQFTHIEQPGTLTVSLVGTGTGFDNTKNFNVLVTFGSAISYTVDGTPVATPSATCTLTLHAGQSKVIGNIPFGTTYVISENVTDEGYALVSITNSSGTMTDGGAFSSVVTNIYHAPGTLTLTKVVSGTGFDASKQFEIVATFGRAISYTVNGTPVSSPTTTYTAHLAHNQSVVLGNIPSGVSYNVVETPLSQQDIDAGYSNGLVVGGSGTMTDAGSKSATANNSFVAQIPGTLNVSLTGTGTDFDTTKSFNVLVSFSRAISYTVNGTPVAVASDTCTLTLVSGASAELGNLPIGVSYTVSATLPQTDIDHGYNVRSISGATGTVENGGVYSSVVTISYAIPTSQTLWFASSNLSTFTANFYESDGTTPWDTYYVLSGHAYSGTGTTARDGNRLAIGNKELGSRVVKFSRSGGSTYIYEEVGGTQFLLTSGTTVSLRLEGKSWYSGSRLIPATSTIRIRSSSV